MQLTTLRPAAGSGGVDAFKTITEEEEEGESSFSPPVSLPARLVKHEIFISCIFGGKAVKGSVVDPQSLQPEHKAKSTPYNCS